MWILQGVCHNPGHQWKDGWTGGQRIYAYSTTLRPPYAPGQHPRVGNPSAVISEKHFTFRRASLREVLRLLPTIASDFWTNWRGPLALRPTNPL